MTALKDQMTRLEGTIEETISKKIKTEVPNIVKKVESTVTKNLAEQIKTAVEAEVQKKIATAPVPTPGTAPQQVSPGTQLKRTVANVSSELRDRQERAKNMIVYNVKEPATNNKEERATEDIDHMINIAKDALGVTTNPGDYSAAIRLGRKHETSDRPLLVSFKAEKTKEIIFKRLGRLRDPRNAKFKHLSFSNDMTKLEREENRRLVEEAKKMENDDASGLWSYKVRGPPWSRKITKLPKNAHVQPDPAHQTPTIPKAPVAMEQPIDAPMATPDQLPQQDNQGGATGGAAKND